MSYAPRPTISAATRQTLTGAAAAGLGASAGSQSAALQNRIAEKRAELDNLKQLRDLSAAVATQMEALEQKLATLSDGTEAIATVLANWHNVLQAINMASAKIPQPPQGQAKNDTTDIPLPQTLVRIPTEHAPALQAQADAAEEAAEGQEGER